MSDSKSNLDSLFLAALELESADERRAFLEKACGDDLSLKDEVERLLKSNSEAGSFLQTPAPELAATMNYPGPDSDRASAMNAGLVAAFDCQQAVIIGRAGHSVLNSLEGTISIPRVTLRDPTSEGAEPIVRPQSAELPERDSDSRYQLQGEIARGGMGAIIKGRDTDLGRDLAIKVLLDEHKSKPEVVQRFIEEAQIGGQLQHPGIAPVYELGQFADRRPFFSMKLVKGETLSKLLADRTEPSVDRTKFIGIFEQVCQTMAYAHSRGVIHRDLKPANIMVGAFGEVQVMDWGLAKVLQAGGVADERKARDQLFGLSSIRTLRRQAGSDLATATLGGVGSVGSQTQVGSVMGTPAYMPPEQALGEIDALDERADVFGLGAILCEILTGKPPYVSEDGTVIYRMATRGQLTECYERLAACGCDEELVAITKQCLSSEPVDRPRNASVLAERISTYLISVESRLRTAELERAAEAARATEALHTVAETQARARAEQRTRRLQLVVAMVVLVAVSVGGVAAFSSAIYQRQLKDDALQAQTKAEDERRKADDLRIKADALRLNAVAAAEREQKLAGAALDAQRRESEMRNLAEEREQITQATLYAAEMNLATQAAEDPSGLRRLGEIIDGWKPDRVVRELRGWEWYYLDSLRRLTRKSIAHQSPLGAKWSSDGKQLVTYGHDTRFRIWQGNGDELQFEVRAHNDYVYEVSWSPDRTRLATAGRDGTLKMWDAKTGAPIGSPFDFGQYIWSVRWSPDGTKLAIKGEREVAIMVAETMQILHRWLSTHGELNIAWHPKLDRLAVPTAVIDGKTGEKLWGHLGHYVEWSADGTRLVTSAFERAWILSSDDGRELATLTIPNAAILSMATNPVSDAIAFGLRDSTVRVWNPMTSEPLVILRGNLDGVRHVSWNNDGTLLAATSPESTRLFDWPARTNPVVFKSQYGTVRELVWSSDGKSVGACTEHLDVWQRDQNALQRSVVLGSGGIEQTFGPSVSWCEKSHTVATRRELTKLLLLDDQTGELRLEIPHDCTKLRSVAFNADGTRLVTSNYRSTTADRAEHAEICLYDAQSGARLWLKELDGHRAGGLAWSPDNRRIVCCGWTSFEILNAEDGQSFLQSDISNDLGWIHEAKWSPDGERLALACLNHTVRLVSSRTGRETGKLVGHTGPVMAVSWSPDGQRLATGSGDKTVRIWNSKSGLQVLALRQHQSSVESVSWSPDGQQLASGAGGGEVLIWDARVGMDFAGNVPPPVQPLSNSNPPQSLASAEQELERLKRLLAADAHNRELLGARGLLLARLGRWSESASSYEQLTKFDPSNRYGWSVAATPMLMAGEIDRYREHCRAMLKNLNTSPSAEVADAICKTSLLFPDTVPLSELPIRALRDGIKDPNWQQFRSWFLACSALVAYREGQPQEAVRWTSQMPDFRSQPGALALVVRAMSEHKLDQPTAARESLKAAELQIPLQLRTLGRKGDTTPLPVPLGIVDHDWIIPEILRREAEHLMGGKKN
ncbi:MAG: protein kinase [Planctomycetaceae bacterium]